MRGRELGLAVEQISKIQASGRYLMLQVMLLRSVRAAAPEGEKPPARAWHRSRRGATRRHAAAPPMPEARSRRHRSICSLDDVLVRR